LHCPFTCITPTLRQVNSYVLLAAATIVRAEAGNGSSAYDYDIITIGAGSGGVRASRFATSYGEQAAIAVADTAPTALLQQRSQDMHSSSVGRPSN
jgi:hypothetical protein